MPPPTRGPTPEISVVVPVAERADDLVALYRSYAAEVAAVDPDYEFLFVFDGSFGAAPSSLVSEAESDPHLRALELAHAFGETGALRVGISACRGRLIFTLSSYFQVVPRAIPALLEAVENGADLAVAHRDNRRDGWINRMQGRLFHRLVRLLTGAKFSDIACGTRLMRREVAETLTLYGDLHRFIPALAKQEGFRVVEVAVDQHRADARTRVYGPGTYIRRVLDVFSLLFLLKFTEKPLRFFGLIGTAFGLTGFFICLVLAIQRLGGVGLANRPVLLLGVLLIALGVQVIALGLVGEIVVHWHAPVRRTYRTETGSAERSEPREPVPSTLEPLEERESSTLSS